MNTQFLNQFLSVLSTIKFSDIIDILVVAFLFYRLIAMIRSTRAARIALGIVILLVVTWITSVARMNTINFIMSKILEIGFIALVIMFQPELRRILERLGSQSIKELIVSDTEQSSVEQMISATVSACASMSKEHVGALIVFERKMLLDEYFATGTVLDAAVSEQLFLNLFFPRAALHDGAVIVRNSRITAAACVLPLSENSHLSAELGTRHRAGIGMSEVTDAVVVLVSEETGTISVAVGGMLKRHLAPKTLERLLRNELAVLADETGPTKFVDRLRQRLKKKDGTHEK